MATKPIVIPTSTGSQRNNRYTDTFHDTYKHARFPNGRPFCGEREYAANKGHPDGFTGGDLQCGDHEDPFNSVWSAPWLPPMNPRYWNFNYARRIIRLRYDVVQVDETQATRDYYRRADKLAASLGWAKVERKGPVSPQIESVIGTPPLGPRIAEAAATGDPWLMGAIDEPNEELAALLGIDVHSASGLSIVRPRIEPALTPQQIAQVDAAPVDQTAAIVAAVLAAIDAREQAKKDADKAKMAKARAARGGTKAVAVPA